MPARLVWQRFGKSWAVTLDGDAVFGGERHAKEGFLAGEGLIRDGSGSDKVVGSLGFPPGLVEALGNDAVQHRIHFLYPVYERVQHLDARYLRVVNELESKKKPHLMGRNLRIKPLFVSIPGEKWTFMSGDHIRCIQNLEN